MGLELVMGGGEGAVQSFWFRRHQCIGGDGSPGKKAAELSEIEDDWEPGADTCGRRRDPLGSCPGEVKQDECRHEKLSLGALQESFQ